MAISRLISRAELAVVTAVETRGGRGRPEAIRLSVVVPTLGRSSLATTLDSCAGAQEILIVGDGPGRARAEQVVKGRPAVRLDWSLGQSRDWGYSQRRRGVALATGTHICFIDDDDELAPGAPEVIRRKVAKAPPRVHIFRMRYVGGERDGVVLWKEPAVRMANVAAQMIVVPNDGRLGTWGDRYEGDFDFLVSTLERRGQKPIWHRNVIALIHWQRTEAYERAHESRR